MKIILIGSKGRMGKSMQEYLQEKNIEFLAIDKDDRHKLETARADVIVDFSTSDALAQNLEFAKNSKTPIVVATTNHNKTNFKLFNVYKKMIPIFYSPNMSIQFNLMAGFINKLKILEDCDFVVSEVHHKHKKDKPSGSAKLLIKKLNQIKIKPYVHCTRASKIIGEHKLQIYGNLENLEIKHCALDRKVFCEGAVKACEFIIKKSNGFYNMENLIDSL